MTLKSFSLGKASVKAAGLAMASVAIGLTVSAPAQASTFTRTSPTSAGLLPGAVSEIGGVVLDLVGTNGSRVVTQTAASTLFEGFAPGNPLVFGTQTGFDSAIVNSLGGGLSQVAVRITLDDGDSASGDFDFNENTLLLNGIAFGNFSSVNAVNTDSNGNETALGFSGGGFRNGRLDTGFFFSNDSSALASLFTSLSSGSVAFAVDDLSPGDNFYNFKQGLDASLVNSGTGPITGGGNGAGATTDVPEPFTVIGSIIGGTAAFRMRKKLKSSK
jgi:hypothetical protein